MPPCAASRTATLLTWRGRPVSAIYLNLTIIFDAPASLLIVSGSSAQHSMRFEQRAHKVQNPLCVPSGCHLEKGAGHPPVTVQHKCGALRHPAFEHAECARQCASRIGQQREGQAMFFGKAKM